MRIIRMLRLLRLAWKPRDFALAKLELFHPFLLFFVVGASGLVLIRAYSLLLCTCNVNQPCGRVVI